MIDVRVIVRFPIKSFFSRMKSNFKYTSFKKLSEVPKISLKKAFIHPNTLVITHFLSHTNKKSFTPTNCNPKRA